MEKPDDEVVYNRLAVLRAERQWTRRQLAEALGVHYQTIGYIERGDFKPSLFLAFRIAEMFGLPIDAVFSIHPFETMSGRLYGSPKEQQ